MVRRVINKLFPRAGSGAVISCCRCSSGKLTIRLIALIVMLVSKTYTWEKRIVKSSEAYKPTVCTCLGPYITTLLKSKKLDTQKAVSEYVLLFWVWWGLVGYMEFERRPLLAKSL